MNAARFTVSLFIISVLFLASSCNNRPRKEWGKVEPYGDKFFNSFNLKGKDGNRGPLI